MHYANIFYPRFGFILLQIVLQEIEIMNQGKTVFAQIMSLIPRYEFDKCVKRYNGNLWGIILEMEKIMTGIFSIEEEEIIDAIINKSDNLAHFINFYQLQSAS